MTCGCPGRARLSRHLDEREAPRPSSSLKVRSWRLTGKGEVWKPSLFLCSRNVAGCQPARHSRCDSTQPAVTSANSILSSLRDAFPLPVSNMPSIADWTRVRSEPDEVATEFFRILFRGPDALRLLQLLHPTNRTFGSGIEDRLEWCHAAGSSYAFRNPQAWRIFWPRDREFRRISGGSSTHCL